MNFEESDRLKQYTEINTTLRTKANKSSAVAEMGDRGHNKIVRSLE